MQRRLEFLEAAMDLVERAQCLPRAETAEIRCRLRLVIRALATGTDERARSAVVELMYLNRELSELVASIGRGGRG